jgi:hypothetical protein
MTAPVMAAEVAFSRIAALLIIPTTILIFAILVCRFLTRLQ